jgi:hypothetical protein
MLKELDGKVLSEMGRKYLRYFEGLEEFSREFYQMEYAYQQSLKYRAEGNLEKAVDAIRKCRPEEIIEQYARFSAGKGITKGEKGILISLNLDWVPYIENQLQAVGEKPIRYNFAPTVHPKFGQGILRTNFFFDSEQHLWRNFGQEETDANTYYLGATMPLDENDTIPDFMRMIWSSGIESDSLIQFTIRPLMAGLQTIGPNRELLASELLPGDYRLQLLFSPSAPGKMNENMIDIAVYDQQKHQPILTDRIALTKTGEELHEVLLKNYEIFVSGLGELRVEISPLQGKSHICGAVLKLLKRHD